MFHDLDLASTVAALCGSGDPRALYGVLLALFSVGFFGGFAHCGPMCGPFVLMQIGGRDAGPPTLHRLATGFLPFYQLGRLMTYAVLGAVAGGFGASFVEFSHFHGAVSALLAVAASAFLLQGLKGTALLLRLRPSANFGTRFSAVFARAAAPLLRGTTGSYLGPRGFFLGIVLGFLPCGFLYAAVIAAMATGNALAGALAMLAFGLGTVPALAAIGLAGTSFVAHWRRIAAAAMPAIFLLNAATLGGIALHLAG